MSKNIDNRAIGARMNGWIKRAAFAAAAVLIGASVACAQFASQAQWGGTSGGSANAQTLTIANYARYITGVEISFAPGSTNNGPTTININGIGNVNIFKKSGAGPIALSGGELLATSPAQIVDMKFDGVEFQITSSINDTAAAVKTPPQGYLTPCQTSAGSPVSGCVAGQLVPTGDVVSATSLWYEPDQGNQIPIWNGSNMIQLPFSEQQLTIPSSRLANTLYDVCVFNNAGTPTPVFSTAWTTSTAGSGARGTGAGTAQITQLQGVWTNGVAISGVNGANTFSIPINQCTIVGTVLIDGSAGQVTFNTTFGQSRKWAAWNFYNRRTIGLRAGDSTASWSSSGSVFRPENGNTANSLTVIAGLDEEKVSLQAFMNASATIGASGTMHVGAGIGLNSTTAASGPSSGQQLGVTTNFNASLTANGAFIAPPWVGINVLTLLENTAGGSGVTWAGTEANSALYATWRG